DFQATMDLIEKVRYHGAFSFKYSSRPPAKSCDFEEIVSEEEKARRLAILQNRQKEITMERHLEYVGQSMELMIEGKSKVDGQWCGRSRTNHTVNFESNDIFTPGQLVTVKITEACYNSLRGTITPSV
ncbi:MAG: TRAM domain-containing protein, partial [Desulfobulbaceae bacterium]|nr:TRAM domain-containing protein [Desulfobulbaceae bacterium]